MLLDNHGHSTNRESSVRSLHGKLPTPTPSTLRFFSQNYQVGIVENYTISDWKTDMAQAQAIGIDGFALNCAPPRVDSYTPKQLANAYEAAAQLNFSVFISFDFAYWSTGDVAEITSFVANYSSHPAQATWDGDDMNWNSVKAGLGDQKLSPIPMFQDPNAIPQAGGESWC